MQQQIEISNLNPWQEKNDTIEDTIVAIATPPGKGGIGIIRISGKHAVSIGKKIFRYSKISQNLNVDFKTHRIYYGTIIDPENEDVIDEVILLPMIAPRSYTREDIIEIHAHSGRAVLEKILRIVLKHHARIAEPGEFTKRAFLNGRIDLTQAEAIIDIINAETESARAMASGHLEGRLRNELVRIRSYILKALGEIEAQIEFSEDQGEDFIEKHFWNEKIYKPLKKLLETASFGQLFKDGIIVALAGKPNVGKSSIMNRLLYQERAIVTPFPGTTRDHIEESIEIKGYKIRLFDTAGIRASHNPIEKIGIEKTRSLLKQAELVLLICDASGYLCPEDYEIYDIISKKRKILVFNKKDLLEKNHKTRIPSEWEKEQKIYISALENDGIDELREIMVGDLSKWSSDDQSAMVISSVRQKQNIEKCIEAIEKAINCHDRHGPSEIVSIEFAEAKKQIDQALGFEFSEDILDQVFKNFCIGK